MYENGSITLTKAALVDLINGAFIPNPDDTGDPNNPWGPYGPIGPVIRDRLSWALLNPQPLPPGGPHPEPWRTGPGPQPWRMGPTPDPWRAVQFARTVIDRAVAQYQFAEVLTGMDERTFDAIGEQIREFIDEFCGTRPPRWPRPWPRRWSADDLQPLDLLVAGAQFQYAADAMEHNRLQTDLAAAADQLIETGLSRMRAHQDLAEAM